MDRCDGPSSIRRYRLDCDRAVFLGDLHVPYYDPVAVDLTLTFAKSFRPHVVFLIGDFLDCYAISRYDKDPSRLTSFQDEIDEGRRLLRRLRKDHPRARIVYLDGNHEDRVRKFLWKNPEVSSLKVLTIPSLLGLDELDIEHRTYGQSIDWHGLMIEHGDRVKQKSAYTAAAMLEARGVCGLSGHTHRLGTYYRSDEAGAKAWFENGCLCDCRPSYVIGKPNWMQGFSVGYGLKGDNRFVVDQIPIIKHRLYYRGDLWSRPRRERQSVT